MGGGMIFKDCDDCDGDGKIATSTENTQNHPVNVAKREIKIDKRSKEYKSAIKRIRSLNENISEEEAYNIFEKEWDKL